MWSCGSGHCATTIGSSRPCSFCLRFSTRCRSAWPPSSCCRNCSARKGSANDLAAFGLAPLVKVVVFGATGMVGHGALRESLRDPDVTEVLAVTRTSTGVKDPKLEELQHDNFYDFTP